MALQWEEATNADVLGEFCSSVKRVTNHHETPTAHYCNEEREHNLPLHL